MVKDIPRSTIRSIAMGLSEIHGRIKAKQTLESPISNVPCVYYKYEIQVYRSSKNGGTGLLLQRALGDFRSTP